MSCLQQQRYQHAIIFRIGDSDQQLVLTTGVLNHLVDHQQIGRNAPEAGGQLFARFDGELIHVERATGPRSTDRRSRFGYIPDHRADQEEINAAHREGLHFIGDWHTHPEPRPTPSFYDVRSIRSVVAGSKHHLNGFVLLIAGTDPFPRGLFVSLYGKHAITPLIVHEP
ncbi:MAG: Mov34/MPN/PAD-1 family protein [Janthinobacterium lividum]